MTEDSDWQPGVVFTHTLSLILDDEAQEVLRDVRNRLMAAGIPVLHEPAHVTVAAVSTMNGVDSDLVDVGWPERVTLTTSCYTAAAAVFRASRVPEALRRPHEALHRRLAEVGVTAFNYYGPRWWNPHVTMGYQVPPELRGRAVELLADVVPLEVGVMGISVWCVGNGQTYALWS